METIVISLGGSIIVPDNIDINFLKSFRDLIVQHIKNGKRFIITTGGGKICRRYQDSAKELSNPSNEDLDWIGIASLKLNAELMRVIFGEYAHKKVIANLSEPFEMDSPVVVGSAYRPEASSDVDAILGAITIGAKRVINLSNIDYVYDSDPKVNPDAKKMDKISWSQYRDLIPKEWSPGLNTPFDPIASEMAEKEGIEVNILNGKNISNLEKCLNGDKFMGTVIN